MYLFALRIAVSKFVNVFYTEAWLMSTCHLRQGRLAACVLSHRSGAPTSFHDCTFCTLRQNPGFYEPVVRSCLACCRR